MMNIQRPLNRGFESGTQTMPMSDPKRTPFPTFSGNASRPIVSPNYHDLIADSGSVIEMSFKIRTWLLVSSPLLVAWPKVRITDGVKFLTGVRSEHIITPFTEVPQRGTVRMMNRRVYEYTLTMSQKGIGARIHGSVLNGPDGPEELSRHVDSFAEAFNVTMALQTATNMVNTAYQQGLVASDEGTSLAFRERTRDEIQAYATLGLQPRGLPRLVNAVMQRKPSLNTVFIPDNSDLLLDDNLKPEYITMPLFTHDGVQYVPLDSKQSIRSLTTLNGGSTVVFPMPTFSVPGNHNMTIQPLESEFTIGEVYFERQSLEFGTDQSTAYRKGVEDVYLFDHTIDFWGKVKFSEAVRYTHIWETSQNGYSQILRNYVNHLNARKTDKPTDWGKRPEKNDRAGIALPYPVAAGNDSGDIIHANTYFYLPSMFGNISDEHLPMDQLEQIIESGITALTVADDSTNNFATAVSGMESVDTIRSEIEDLPYDAESFENIARLNINRSVFKGADGAVEFKGQITPANRLLAMPNSRAMPIVEWTPNAHGGLDIDRDTKAVGMFSAAGLRTLRNTSGHPLQRLASDAYLFCDRLAARYLEILGKAGNPAIESDHISPHFHRDDRVQVVLELAYGRRIPIFLKAPKSLVNEREAQHGNTFTDINGKTYKVVAGTGNPDDGIIVKNDENFFFRTPEGVVVDIGKTRPSEVEIGSDLAKDDLVTAIINYWATKGVSVDWPSDGNVNIGEAERVAVGHATLEFVRKLVDAMRGEVSSEARRELAQLAALIMVRRSETGLEEFDTAIQHVFASGRGKKSRNKIRSDLSEMLPDRVEVQRIGNETESVYTTILNKNTRGSLNATSDNAQLARNAQQSYTTVNAVIKDAVQSLHATDQSTYGKSFYIAPEGADPVQLVGHVNLLTELANAGLDDLAERLTTAIQNSEIEVALDLRLRSSLDANVLDVANAKAYRAPLNMTWRMFDDILKVEHPWILPGDPTKAFIQPLSLSNLDQRNKAERILKQGVEGRPYAHLYNTQSDITAAHFDPSGQTRDQFFDQFFVSADYRSAIEFLKNGLGLGPIHKRLQYVRSQYASNMVKRLIGVTILLTPHDSLESILNLHKRHIMPPFELALWRLWSTYVFGDVLVMKRGIEAGINMYNNENFIAAFDGNRNDATLRVTADMESHAINPELHALIGPVQPRGYIGGHDVRIVKDPHDILDATSDMRDRPSIIATVMPRGQGATREFPLSFLNELPGRVDRSRSTTTDANIRTQYWSNSDFYGFVYGAYFQANNVLLFDSPTQMTMSGSFDSSNMHNNHLAWAGFQGRLDIQTKRFNRILHGNGHRGPALLNCPGAQAYMEGGHILQPRLMIENAMLT